jgi:hypothetical protein
VSKTAQQPIRVSDHAVIRYLERAQGFDIEAVRAHIAGLCGPAARAGAKTVIAEGLRFELGIDKVVTCTPANGGHCYTRRQSVAIVRATR